MKRVLTLIFGIIVVAGLVWTSRLYWENYQSTKWTPPPPPSKILPSWPLTSTPPPPLDVSDLIHVREPQQEGVIKRPVTVVGEARGNWFFEASFPIKVLDEDGTVLGVGNATAMGEWMTTEFVSFRNTIEYKQPKSVRGTIVFEKDNPSELPENAAEIRIPVFFRETAIGVPSDACRPTGCSGEICSDTTENSVCWFKPEFACYKNTVCERQKSGKCGWTMTKELSACVSKTRSEPIVPQ